MIYDLTMAVTPAIINILNDKTSDELNGENDNEDL
tara:strand:+ start:182 stop:286 length:105 start_codon:yes stop_codon:yes gene_type:complete